MLRELLLQRLVRVVDAQLLEAVGLEALEAVDIQDRDELAAAAPPGVQALVDAVDNLARVVCVCILCFVYLDCVWDVQAGLATPGFALTYCRQSVPGQLPPQVTRSEAGSRDRKAPRKYLHS